MILGAPPLRDSDIADMKTAHAYYTTTFKKNMEASSGSPPSTLQKFNTLPLKQITFPKKNACLPNHYVSGAMLNLGGV